MQKNFVFDTNVLLHDPRAIFKFEDNNVIIPIYVIEEIDTFKKEMTELGRNARETSRIIDRYRMQGKLGDGVAFENGGILKVPSTSRSLDSEFLHSDKKDNLILAVALDIQDSEPETPCILLTKDVNLRIRANALGIKSENYEEQDVSISELYPGACELDVPVELIDQLHEDGEVEVDLTQYDPKVTESAENGAGVVMPRYYTNEYVLLKNETGGKQNSLGRITLNEDKDPTKARIKPLTPLRDTVWGLRPRNKEQYFALDALLDKDIELVTLIGKAGTGKAQPLDARIMTPDGWRMMGQIERGMQVMTPDGTPAEVLDVFPQGEKEIYRVHFTDGTETECCKEHLWYTRTTLNRDQGKPGSVKSLEEILGSLRYGAQRKRNHSIPITDPLNFAPREQAVDPYLLGVLIGDGSMSVGHLSLSTGDDFIRETCEPLLHEIDCHFGAQKQYDHSICCEAAAGAPSFSFVRRDPETGQEWTYENIHEAVADGFEYSGVYRACDGSRPMHREFEWRRVEPENSSVHPLKNFLLENRLWGCRSEDKFIPEDYLFGSIDQRVALLQGLMDTDGTIDEGGHQSFTTTSEQLANQFRSLVQSLGGTVKICTRTTSYTHNGEHRQGRLSYRCNVCLPNEVVPFRLPRKLERVVARSKYNPRRYIDCIEYVGKKAAQCILIDHPDHLYLTDHCIVTHNTLLAIAAGLRMVTDDQSYGKLVVSRPIFPMGRDIGYLPGTVEEKLNPWMRPIFDNVEHLMGVSSADKRAGRGAQELIDMGIIEIEPLTYIRGRSMPNLFLIVDEAQNLTPHEVKTILTRVGEGTKIVLTGDPYQIDNPYVDSESNGLTYVVTKFKGQQIGATISLFKGERSELAELAANIL
jgi:predicted ribonuclease YlaK